MKFENNIFAVIDPSKSILPEKIEVERIREGKGDNADRVSKSLATMVPFVRVNNYIFSKESIKYFKINTEGHIPTLSLNIIDQDRKFKVDSFPRDGDVVTVLLNSKNSDTFKSIHMDFDITSVNTRKTKDSEPVEFRLNGQTKIPGLYTEDCQHLPENTSLKHIEEICKNIGLGMATNIDTTNDKQIRIQPYITYLDWIKETVKNSYISDNSFQNFFIDPYYYLNFIDVNRLLNSPNPKLEEMQETLSAFITTVSTDPEKGSEDTEDKKLPHILTNHTKLQGQNIYISSYRILNNSSHISLKNGIFNEMQIYDDNTDIKEKNRGDINKKDKFTLEPLNSNNMMEREEPLKGRRGENRYKKQKKHQYLGRQQVGDEELGNVHANYLFTMLNNDRNYKETQKMKLAVHLDGFNPSIYTYQKIPVFIYVYNNEEVRGGVDLKQKAKDQGFEGVDMGQGKQMSIEGDGAFEPDMILDEFLSGYYLVESINYVYNYTDRPKDSGAQEHPDAHLTQELILIRREWPARVLNAEKA